MNTTRSFILAATLSAGLTLSLAASAANYTALDLGTIFPISINNNGQVLGFAPTPFGFFSSFGFDDVAVITGINGQTSLSHMNNLGGINDAGQVAGTRGFWPYPTTALFTGPGGVGETELSPSAGTRSYAHDINNNGQVVGSYVTNSGQLRSFITGPNGVGFTDLNTLGVGGGESAANVVNASGQVAGYFYRSEDQKPDGTSSGPHAFITGPNGTGMVPLFAQIDEYSSYAQAINDTGQVTGNMSTLISDRNFASHVFITGANGKGITFLGTLDGTDYSQAYDINASGWVVGTSIIKPRESTDSYQGRAFIANVDGGGMMDLTSFVNIKNSNLTFSGAPGINDLGQIIALGNDGHSYLLSPIPEPESYALMLAGLGLVGCIAHRKKQIPLET